MPASLQAQREYTSPSSSTGRRVPARRMSKKVSLATPRSKHFTIGMYIPSSNTERPSGPMPSPPTSITWAVLANRPIIWPPWKAGETTVRSCRWPVPSHGSFVMKWSPGFMVAAGKRRRKWPTLSIIEFTWPGVPVTACASIRPCRSNTPADRSPDSRTVVENAVRIIVCACSSTTAMRRFQRMP